LILLGFLLARKLKGFLVVPSKGLRKILFWVIVIIPFGIGFIFNPIYQGDFSNDGKMIVLDKKMREFKNFDLIVLTIPDCPFCHEAVGTINRIQVRNPEMKIKFIICSSDKNQIEPYKNKLNTDIKVVLAKNLDGILALNKGSFPSFIISKDKEVCVWSNDSFGVRAKDFLENSIKIKE
jgi:hypothetical protein